MKYRKGLFCVLVLCMFGCTSSLDQQQVKSSKYLTLYSHENVEKKELEKEKTFNNYEITQYKIIEENVPAFDVAPIDYRNKKDRFTGKEYNGYIFRENGLFGFIDVEGKVVMQPKYEYVIFEPGTACYMPDMEKKGPEDGTPLGQEGRENPDRCGSGYGAALDGRYLTFDNSNGLYYTKIDDMEMLPYTEYEQMEVREKYGNIKVIQESVNLDEYGINRLDHSTYYLLTTDGNKLFGPYQEDEVASMSWIIRADGYRQYDFFQDIDSNFYGVDYQETSDGLFYEKTKNGYKVWNSEGTQSSDEFDSASLLSNNTIKFKKGNNIGIINENLDILLYGKFEDVTRPIDGKAFVKKDGRWILIKIV